MMGNATRQRIVRYEDTIKSFNLPQFRRKGTIQTGGTEVQINFMPPSSVGSVPTRFGLEERSKLLKKGNLETCHGIVPFRLFEGS